MLFLHQPWTKLTCQNRGISPEHNLSGVHNVLCDSLGLLCIDGGKAVRPWTLTFIRVSETGVNTSQEVKLKDRGQQEFRSQRSKRSSELERFTTSLQVFCSTLGSVHTIKTSPGVEKPAKIKEAHSQTAKEKKGRKERREEETEIKMIQGQKSISWLTLFGSNLFSSVTALTGGGTNNSFLFHSPWLGALGPNRWPHKLVCCNDVSR